jgi:alpha-amylase/alpha-mannosidase (GH57 family)
MNTVERFPVVLLWHMHQPDYRDAISGEYRLPWTLLHAIKDYTDMAAHLEAAPAARAVINFTPVLLEQLQELAVSTRMHLRTGAPLPDPVLAVLGTGALPADPALRLHLLKSCLRAHAVNLIGRFPAYAELARLAQQFMTEATVGYASDQFLHDVGVWYYVAWLGETIKRGDQRVAALIAQQRMFTTAHRRTLLELIAELLEGLLPRYRALCSSGQLEVAISPYAHPILPLLLDFSVARESQPGVALPAASAYPGGAARADWHLQHSVQDLQQYFGARPTGCWPSEGALSGAALDRIADNGFQWIASGGTVLHGTLSQRRGDSVTLPESTVYTHVSAAGNTLNCVFRNDGLSDLIGFSYSTWHGDDAVAHCVAEIERVIDAARASSDRQRMLLIALDGENAWEHYPYNGFYFLQGLYAALVRHPRLKLCTMSECLQQMSAADTVPLGRVRAGSWVHGSLATWIGDADKNRGWDLLVAAKRAVDAALLHGNYSVVERDRILKQLAHCESSDWFWWFGDYNPADSVRDFDELFRHQLANLYQLIGVAAPQALTEVISRGRGDPEGGGVMRRADA